MTVPPALAQHAARAVAARDIALRKLELCSKQLMTAQAEYDKAERECGSVARAIQIAMTSAPPPAASASVPASTPAAAASTPAALPAAPAPEPETDEDAASAVLAWMQANTPGQPVNGGAA